MEGAIRKPYQRGNPSREGAMTIDDDNSIYVGGLPYDATEDTLRHDFSFFGSVVAVKIINDREVGGKCYGFITFTNPRSAIHAIEDMNGRTIGGRVVRVSEVRTRGGKPSFHRENFRRDDGRDIDWDRDNDREKDYVRDRDRYRGRYTERSRERERERGKDYELGRDSDREIDHTFDRGRDMEEHDRERTRENDRDWERGHDVNWSRDREMDKAKEHDGGRDNDKEQQSRNRFSARVTDRHSRESSSDSDDVSQGQVKEQLEMSIQIHEDLESELCLIQVKMNEKEQLVSDLQKKYQKLEDALADARKLTTQRELVLTKLHRCFMQTQEYNLRLKSSEQELQLLVDTEMDDTGVADDTNTRNGSAYANGQV